MSVLCHGRPRICATIHERRRTNSLWLYAAKITTKGVKKWKKKTWCCKFFAQLAGFSVPIPSQQGNLLGAPRFCHSRFKSFCVLALRAPFCLLLHTVPMLMAHTTERGGVHQVKRLNSNPPEQSYVRYHYLTMLAYNGAQNNCIQ